MTEETAVAVIGAGAAGLACARALAASGWPVTVFEKSHAPGGRCATRRRDGDEFDHGAPFAEVSDPAFAAAVARWRAAGTAAAWPAAGPGRVVGRPGMRDLLAPLADELAPAYGARICALSRDAAGWMLAFDDARAPVRAGAVVLAIPAAQAAALLGRDAPEGLDGVVMDPCWTVMARFDAPVAMAAEVVAGDGAPLALAIRNSAKPGRSSTAEQLVLHAGADWTRAHLDDEGDRIAHALRTALAGLTGGAVPAPAREMVHRWLHARVSVPFGQTCYWDARRGIGLAGDWCTGPGVEAAWLSGTTLASRIVGRC